MTVFFVYFCIIFILLVFPFTSWDDNEKVAIYKSIQSFIILIIPWDNFLSIEDPTGIKFLLSDSTI